LSTRLCQAEREKLLSERYALTEQYYDLKDDVRNVEVLRRSAESLISGIEQDSEQTRGKTQPTL